MKNILLIIFLLISGASIGQINPGWFYGSTDGTESDDLKLGYRSSNSTFNYRVRSSYSGGTTNLKTNTGAWGTYYYWQRGSSIGTKSIARIGGSESLGHTFVLYDKNDGTTASTLIRSNGDSYFNGGKVGIGTSSPEQILHVEKSGNTFLQLENTGSNGSTVKFGAVNSNGKKETQIQFEDEFGLYDHANGNWRLKVKRNGNVGIGTTDPDALLTVAGNIKSQEVKVTVDAGQGPDYVFEADYNLRSLEETEEYIKANKHLPEVPSAKVMESEGLNLKEMNLMLLQKVEELTLHQIEQNKNLKSALEKIESLENEIKTLKEN